MRFIGIEDVQFVYAEGLSMGAAPRAAGVADASRAIAALTRESVARAA